MGSRGDCAGDERGDWTTDRQALASAVNALEPRGWTSLHDAVLTSIALRESAAGRVVLLIFTDGSDTSSWLDPQAVVRATERSDLVITAVSAAARPAFGSAREARLALGLPAALRRWFDSDPALFPYVLLERLAEETGGEVLYTSANRDLSSAFQKIVSDFGTRYLITYEPKGVPASGWHPLSVSVKGRSVNVKARCGYWRAPRPPGAPDTQGVRHAPHPRPAGRRQEPVAGHLPAAARGRRRPPAGHGAAGAGLYRGREHAGRPGFRCGWRLRSGRPGRPLQRDPRYQAVLAGVGVPGVGRAAPDAHDP